MKINKWLFLFLVFLLIVSMSALITVLYNNKDIRPEGNSTRTAAFESDESMKYSGRWFRDELGLSRDQMREFTAFNPAFRQEIRSINIQLNSLKVSMLEEMSAVDSDTSRLNALSDSIGELHSDLKKVTWSYYIQLKSICNSEQQLKLRQVFAGMFSGDLPAAGPGRGMVGRQGMRQRRMMISE